MNRISQTDANEMAKIFEQMYKDIMEHGEKRLKENAAYLWDYGWQWYPVGIQSIIDKEQQLNAVTSPRAAQIVANQYKASFFKFIDTVADTLQKMESNNVISK